MARNEQGKPGLLTVLSKIEQRIAEGAANTVTGGAFKDTGGLYEAHLPPEHYPYGVCIPFSAFLKGCRAGWGTFQSFNVDDLYKYVPVIYESLSDAKLRVFESALTDTAMLTLNGVNPRHTTTKYIPWAHSDSVEDIYYKNRVILGGRSGCFTSLPLTLLQSLTPLRKQNRLIKEAIQTGTTDDIKLNAQVLDRFISGPDIDGRIHIPPDQLPAWSEDLVQQIATSHHIPDSQITRYEQDGKKIVRFVFKGDYIKGWKRNQVAISHNEILDTKLVPAIEVETGAWASGIPYVTIRFVGIDSYFIREIGDKPLDPDVITPWVELGLSSDPSLLPPSLANKDTRTAPGTINSYASISSPVSTKPGDIVPSELLQNVPPIDEWNNVVTIGRLKIHGVHGGVFAPRFSNNGCLWENGKYLIRTYYLAGEKPTQALQIPEIWFYLDPSTLKQLSSPIQFGERFGAMSGEVTFLEFLRTVRYALQSGNSIAETDHTNAVFSMIRGDTPTETASNLPEALRTYIDSHGKLDWVNIDTIRELTSCLYFAPKEFIEIGKRAGFDKYFPRWNLLESIQDELPTRDELIQILTGNQNRIVYGLEKTGFTSIYGALKRKYKKDPEYKQVLKEKNELECVFWLAGLI